MLALLTRLFPLWAILLSVAAYYTPTTFTGISPYVSPLLMLIMFAMGVTLRLDDFKRVLARPGPVAAGIFLHYLIMPLAAGSGDAVSHAAGLVRRHGAGGQRGQRHRVQRNDSPGQG